MKTIVNVSLPMEIEATACRYNGGEVRWSARVTMFGKIALHTYQVADAANVVTFATEEQAIRAAKKAARAWAAREREYVETHQS